MGINITGKIPEATLISLKDAPPIIPIAFPDKLVIIIINIELNTISEDELFSPIIQ